MLTTLPLIAYGSAEDLSTWSQSGTATVASGITDPFGGTGAYSVQDDAAGAFEYRYKTWTETAGGTVTVGVFAKDDNGTGDLGIGVYDQTAATMRHWVTYSFASNAFTGSSVESGSGTVFTPLTVGGNWFFLMLTASSCVAGNVHQLQLRPGAGSASATVTSYFYVRNVCLFDYMDDVTSFPRPREGSVWAQTPSGTEDAWITGTDEVLRARARWIPAAATESPVFKSGWYGANEIPGVNMGVKALLAAGRAKTSLAWVPSRAACSTYQAGYLVEPLRDGVELEPNGERAVALELRGASVFTGV